ncbi:MAG: FAD-dependent oxidoreductase [Nitrospirota bacterium]
MRIAVIGGGINGVMVAWAAAKRGHRVTLFERNQLMSATSGASTRLLHGGLRYLEQGDFRQVAEGLYDRQWWLAQTPDLAWRLKIFYPVYADSQRGRLKIKLGLWLYDRLAGSRSLGPHAWVERQAVIDEFPGLRAKNLKGAYVFWDGQMDDRSLGLWAAAQASAAGVEMRLRMPVHTIDTRGSLITDEGCHVFNLIINAAGPWAEALLTASGLPSPVQLDLVRGSHLLISRPLHHGLLVEVPGEARICFILPYQGKSLVGTTEVSQGLDEPITCSPQEHDYLRRVYDHTLKPPIGKHEIIESYAGIRPLVRDQRGLGRTSRASVIHKHGRLISVFGGKWTTSHSLGERVAGMLH